MSKTKVWKTYPLVRRDFDDILAIEKLSSVTPWLPVYYKTLMRTRSIVTTGIVVRDRSVGTDDWGRCVGVCLTRRIDKELHILRLCVDPDYRGKGVGSALFRAVRERVERNPRGYSEIHVAVPERCYGSIVPFFNKMGCHRIFSLVNIGTKEHTTLMIYKPEENDAN